MSTTAVPVPARQYRIDLPGRVNLNLVLHFVDSGYPLPRYSCSICCSILQLYCSFVFKWRIVLGDPLWSTLRRREISQSGFLNVNRYSVVPPGTPYRVTSSFSCYVDILTRIFDHCMSCSGLYGGLYGQDLRYKFKTSYGNFQNRDSEKLHRTTGLRSDLRPDSWYWANSGLDSTSSNVETESFWVTTTGT